jgi:class 3 adenylate cyclase
MTVFKPPPTGVHASARFEDSEIFIAPEAIVIIDIVQATAINDLFGWYAVGRGLVRELRSSIEKIGSEYGLSCIKSTGDGFLLAYSDSQSAEFAAIKASQASFALLELLTERNQSLPEERRINIRIAIHFGEIDVLTNDREGPNVSYAFRLEAIDRASLPLALNPIESEKFPLKNYIICSENVSEIIKRQQPMWLLTSCGLFKLKGFSGWWEIFLLSV